MKYKKTKLSTTIFFGLALFGLQAQTVTDIDGNVYKTVTIGSQTWFAENLAVTKYNDGKEIPNLTGKKEWNESISGAYCWYENNPVNKTTYGALYNWYAAKGKLCPSGWHVPDYNEWETLTTSVGGSAPDRNGFISIADGKLMEKGTEHWRSPNKKADNSSGFTALPGGNRVFPASPKKQDFVGMSYFGEWWSTRGSGAATAWYFEMSWVRSAQIKSDGLRYQGFSVRCLKD